MNFLIVILINALPHCCFILFENEVLEVMNYDDVKAEFRTREFMWGKFQVMLTN